MMQTNIAGVQFFPAGKIYDFSYKNLVLQVGDAVCVDDEKGNSVARVAVLKYENLAPHKTLRSVIRLAGSRDLDAGNYPGDQEAQQIASRAIKQFQLKMEVVGCRLQLGSELSSQKVIIFFSAPDRVDFRLLVKKLAGELRSRIELRQIGARDQTKLAGGVGICGRQYCCSTFLREFVPVSIKMAKNQNLALNPSQISGGCGRLRCCLSYENDMYTQARAKLPSLGAVVEIINMQMSGVVSHLDILNEIITVKTEAGDYESCSLEELKILSHRRSDRGRRSDSQRPTKSKQKRHKSQDDSSMAEDSSPSTDTWGDQLDLDALMEFQESTQTRRQSPAQAGDDDNDNDNNKKS